MATHLHLSLLANQRSWLAPRARRHLSTNAARFDWQVAISASSVLKVALTLSLWCCGYLFSNGRGEDWGVAGGKCVCMMQSLEVVQLDKRSAIHNLYHKFSHQNLSPSLMNIYGLLENITHFHTESDIPAAKQCCFSVTDVSSLPERKQFFFERQSDVSLKL